MKPILFNTEMVRAILDNRKTVTRRIINPQPKTDITRIDKNGLGKSIDPIWAYPARAKWDSGVFLSAYDLGTCWKPPYKQGDTLYVRETWYYETFYEGAEASPDLPSGNRSWRYVYMADNPDYPVIPGRWKPSIHMPREAARIFLRVTDVYPQKLRDVTEDDAKSEGFKSRAEFISSILKIYQDCTEDSWFWVIEFERIGKQE